MLCEECEKQRIRYFALTLDPVHIGTGGYRLGRVDNAIVREAGTDLPFIPGTSISGVARAYTALIANEGKCAGKGGEKGGKHCGKANCPVCVAFGFSKGDENRSFQGLAQFFDAKILFFPVYSHKGPVWITSQRALLDITGRIEPVAEDRFRPINHDYNQPLNFGWLYLEEPGRSNGILSLTLNDKLPKTDPVGTFCKERILKNAYLLSDGLFSRVVNDNLEVRTSVAIDPETGAAEKGALFTYEAIPRATLLYFDVFYNDPGNFKVPVIENGEKKLVSVDESLNIWEKVKGEVDKGLKLIELMGLGGMGTRGFGRLKVFITETPGTTTAPGGGNEKS